MSLHVRSLCFLFFCSQWDYQIQQIACLKWALGPGHRQDVDNILQTPPLLSFFLSFCLPPPLRVHTRQTFIIRKLTEYAHGQGPTILLSQVFLITKIILRHLLLCWIILCHPFRIPLATADDTWFLLGNTRNSHHWLSYCSFTLTVYTIDIVPYNQNVMSICHYIIEFF